MMENTAVLHATLIAISATATAIVAGYALRHGAGLAVRPFCWLLFAFTFYSVTHLAGLLTLHPGWRLFWENIQWTGIAFIPVLWLYLVIEYTGHDEIVGTKAIGVLSVVPIVTVVLSWTNPIHGYMWTHNEVITDSGLAILEQSFGPWFWVNAIFTYSIIAVGAFLLLRLVWNSDYLYASQSLLLIVGAVVPVLASVITVLELTPVRDPALDLTPYTFAFTGVAFGYGIIRHRLFDLHPATRQIGRTGTIRDRAEGMVILDSERRIIYLNRAATDLFDCDVTDAIGAPIQSFLESTAVDFETGNTTVELKRDDRIYEIRKSPIHDRRDHQIGSTLIVQDVTARKRREIQLARQRDELERVEELNTIIRSVNRALVSATSREEIEQAVCDHLIDTDRYRTVCVADMATWNGDANRWTVAGEAGNESILSTLRRDEEVNLDRQTDRSISTAMTGVQQGPWIVVPLVYGRTAYGALGLCLRGEADAASDPISNRERGVLTELGELIGHAINAVENRRLLAADAIVKLEFRSVDENAPLIETAKTIGGQLELTGLVPDAGKGHLAYVYVDGASAEQAAETLMQVSSTTARPIRKGNDDGLLEWAISDETLIGMLVERGANVLQATAEDGTAHLTVEIASDTDVRALHDRVRQAFPETWLESKSENEGPIERPDSVPEESIEELTDRQQEALEAAYRAGYFDWPRDSTAEEIAETLDISAPTLHAHLRKAQDRLLTDLFDSGIEVRD